MRFLVDECIGPNVADWLRNQGHDVYSVFESARGMDDDAIVGKAFADNRILVTSDKDFGELIYRDRKPHHGVILMRLDDERSQSKIDVLKRLLDYHAQRLPEQFVVVTKENVRIAKQ